MIRPVRERAEPQIAVKPGPALERRDQPRAETVTPVLPVHDERSDLRHVVAERRQLAAGHDGRVHGRDEEPRRVRPQIGQRSGEKMPLLLVRRDQRLQRVRFVGRSRADDGCLSLHRFS